MATERTPEELAELEEMRAYWRRCDEADSELDGIYADMMERRADGEAPWYKF